EHAAKLRLVGHILAVGSANPEIEIIGVFGACERQVARPARRFIMKISKERRQSIAGGLRDMATAAIAFGRVVEQAKAPHFTLAEARLSFQPVVILAGVGVKARLLNLVAGDCNHRFSYE